MLSWVLFAAAKWFLESDTRGEARPEDTGLMWHVGSCRRTFSAAPRASGDWSRVGVFCPGALGLEVFWGSLAPSVSFRPLPRGSELGHAASSLPKPPVPTHQGPHTPVHPSTSGARLVAAAKPLPPEYLPGSHSGQWGGGLSLASPQRSPWGSGRELAGPPPMYVPGAETARGEQGPKCQDGPMPGRERCREGCMGPGRGQGGPGGTYELGRGCRGRGEDPKAPPRELT